MDENIFFDKTFGKNPRINTDVLEYKIFFDVTSERSCEWLVDMKLQIENFVEKCTEGHMWHMQGFSLKVHLPTTRQAEPCLIGRTLFGENVEDEWLLVSALKDMTGHFSYLSVQVCDGDGEFLLIETALQIPGWLKPRSSTNRTWLRGGAMHIIPQLDGKEELSLRDALHCLQDPNVSTTAGPKVQRALERRLTQAKERSRDGKHRFVCMLPIGVAHVVKTFPMLASRAVHAFYTRDPIDMRCCSKMQRFPVEDVVKAPVTLTRHLYAQLVALQEFHTPKPFQRIANHFAGTRQEQSCNTGIRLACGMEILYQREEQQLKKDKSRHDFSWEIFLRCLKNRDFFGEEMDGSQKYKEKMAMARQFYEEQTIIITENDATSTVEEFSFNKIQSACLQIEECLKNLPSPSEFPNTAVYPEDDDSWLEVSPSDLEALLKEEKNAMDEYFEDITNDGMEVSSEEKDLAGLNQIVQGMKHFFSSTSDFEGIETPLWNNNDTNKEDMIHFDMKRLMEILGGDSKTMGKNFDEDEEEYETDSDDESSQMSTSSDEVQKTSRNLNVHMTRKTVRMEQNISTALEDVWTEQKMVDVDLHSVEYGGLENGFAQLESGQLNIVLNETDVKASEDPAEDSDDQDDENLMNPAYVPDQSAVINDRVFLEEYLDSLDKELQETTLSESFLTKNEQKDSEGMTNSDTVGKNDQPLDVDLNLVQNILDSYLSQEGLPGPGSSILTDMGISLAVPSFYDENRNY